MFGIVPRTLWERAQAPDKKNRITLAMRCLLLRGHGRTILVDTGVGHKSSEKFESIYAVDHGHSTLLGSLKRLGVKPADVTDVVLTHFHFDHVGGAVSRDADGGLSLTFPNASHYVQRAHAEWTHESPREEASFLPENIDPLTDSGLLKLLEPDAEPFPNISFVVVDGHTRGQQLPLIADQRGALLFAADLLPTSAHVSPLWIMAYDVEPLETLREKRKILARAAESGWLVVYEHDPVVACSNIEATPSGFRAFNLNASLPDTALRAQP